MANAYPSDLEEDQAGNPLLTSNPEVNRLRDVPIGNEGLTARQEEAAGETIRQERRTNREENGSDGVGGFLADAFTTDTTTASLYRRARSGFEDGWFHNVDESFVLDEDSINAVLEENGFPSHYAMEIAEAVNAEHLQAIVRRLQPVAEAEERLSHEGLANLWRIPVAMVDPAALAAAVGTEGVAAPFVWGARVSRVNRAVRAGAIGAATEGAISAYTWDENPTYGAWDVLGGMAGGLVFGAAAGGFMKGSVLTPAEEAAAIRGVREISTPPVAVEPIATPQPATRADMMNTSGLTPVDVNIPGSGGAASASPHYPLPARANGEQAEDIEELLRAYEDGEIGPRQLTGAEGGLRFDLSANFGNDANPIYRSIGEMLFQDPTGGSAARTGRAMGHSVAELANSVQKQFASQFLRPHQFAFRQWRAAQGGGRRFLPGAFDPHRFITDRRTFNRLVGEAIYSGRTSPDPHVERAASAARDWLERMAHLANNPHESRWSMTLDELRAGNGGRARAVRGAEELEPNRNYFPVNWNTQDVARLERRVGFPALREAFATAIMQKGVITELADARDLAKHLIQTLRRANVGERISAFSGFKGENTSNRIRELLLEEFGDEMTDSRAALIADFLTAGTRAYHNQPGVNVKNLKGRTPVDYETTLNMVDQKTGQPITMRIADLFDHDVETVIQSYTRNMSGHLAFARKGVTHRSEFEDMLANAARADDELAITRKNTNDLADKARATYDYLTGRPVTDNSSWAARQTNRVIKYNFIRQMGETGLYAIQEISQIFGTAGLRHTLASMPAVKDLVQRSITGKMTNEMIEDLELFTGVGTLMLRGRTFNRHLEGTAIDGPTHRTFVDDYLDLYGDTLSYLSGLGPGTDGTSVIAMAAVSRRLAQRARANASSPLANKARQFTDFGWTDDEWQLVRSQLQQHSVYGRGIGGRKVFQTIGLRNWEPEARDLYVNAMNRVSTRMIQENDIGGMQHFMSHWAFRMLGQFKGFAINSYTRQLRNGINHHDAVFFTSLASSMALGSVLYVGQTYANYAGHPHQSEELEKRLAWDRILAASIQRSAYSSLLPDMYDSTMGLAMPDWQFFKNTRSNTDLMSNAFSNPTSSLIENAGQAFGGTARAIFDDDYDFSVQDAEAYRRMAGFGSLWGARNFAYGLYHLADLPETSE